MNTDSATASVRIIRDTYADSLVLLVATSQMSDLDSVSWAGAVMATPAGRENLASEGFTEDYLGDAGSNDLVLAVRASDDEAADSAFEVGAKAITTGADDKEATAEADPRSIQAAVARMSDSNVAIISVPGMYAALEAHHALTAGLHVLLFSDNVPLAEEIELKQRANELGLFVMGPDAGTSVISGTGLGFSNAVRPGPVGVVAAAGTGAQEVSALLDRWGVGVSHVIGVGGRDLSEDVGGLMAGAAIRTLDADLATKAILLVSKPPAEGVANAVLASCQNTPAVATFLGLTEMDTLEGTEVARTLENGALAAAALAGHDARAEVTGLQTEVESAIAPLPAQRRTVRGYFSGGTLCYEAQLIIGDLLGDVYSNEPLVSEHTVPAPDGTHVLLDLGAEEYTEGRPHPMIDPSLRIETLSNHARDVDVAAVLIDVVLGYGAHDDPAGELAPVCEQIMADGGPQVVAYVLGSSSDPQGYEAQVEKLRVAGCIVAGTAARAAYAAAAIAGRKPEWAAMAR